MLKNWIALMSVTGLVVTMSACAPALDDDAAAEAEEAAEAATPAPAKPAPVAAAPKPAPKPVCSNCGIFINVAAVTEKGQGSGIGAIAGAVAGGVIGHQFGSGSGNKAATAAGAIGGGIAGNEIEKRRNSVSYYRVTVRMDEGGSQVVTVDSTAGIGVGTPVRVVGNNLELR